MVFLFLILNFAISWFNAWSTGKGWAESKMAGGMARLMAWCGAIMSACGFTWCYLTILALLAHSFHWLPDRYVVAISNLGYLVIILPLLGSGLGITIGAWGNFWRQKNIMNGGIAAWNTYAQISNTLSAIRFIPEAFSNVVSTFRSGDDDEDSNKYLVLVLTIVLAAVGGGIMTTRAIVLRTSGHTSREYVGQLQARRA